MRAKVELTPLMVKLDNLSNVASKEFLEAAAKKVYDYAVDTAGVSPMRNPILGTYYEASGGAPHRTGELKQSLQYDANETEGWVGTNLEYAIYVHQGTGLWAFGGVGRAATEEHPIPWSYQDAEGNWHTTSGQYPNPFLTRALESTKQEILEELKNRVKEAVK